MRRYAAYPEYKDSGVEWLGEIPKNWNLKRLKFLISIVGGGTPNTNKPEYWGGEIPWVSPKDMKSAYIQETEDYLTELGVTESATKIVEMNAVLIVVRSGILRHSIPVARNTVDVAINQDMKALIPRTGISAAFLHWLIEGNQRALLPLWIKQGCTVESIEYSYMANTVIPLPPISEQQTIARFLDYKTAQIDALIAKKEALLKKLAEKRTALISHAVTKGLDPSAPMKDSGMEWLGEIPAHWDVIALRYACEFLNRKRVPLSSEERGAVSERTYPYYGASGIIDLVEDYIFDEKTILIAEDGANLLSRSTPLAFIADGKYWVNNHAHILKPIKGPFEYWANLLCITEYDPWITGAAQPKLTKENLGGIKLPMPPEKEQLRIAEYIGEHTADIDSMIGKVENVVDKLKEYRTALITRAVTGKIDMRNVPIPERDEEAEAA